MRKEIDTLSGIRSSGSRRRQFSGSSVGGLGSVFANSNNANDGSARSGGGGGSGSGSGMAVVVAPPPESPVPSPKFR